MARAPFNVLVYPYRKSDSGQFEYALLKRSDNGWWLGVTGGGEDQETSLQAAVRETYEETGIAMDSEFIQLDTVIPVAVTVFTVGGLWGKDTYVIPQYSFGVSAGSGQIVLSHEHTEYRWLEYEQAYNLMEFDGNKTALWELDRRVRGLGPRD